MVFPLTHQLNEVKLNDMMSEEKTVWRSYTPILLKVGSPTGIKRFDMITSTVILPPQTRTLSKVLSRQTLDKLIAVNSPTNQRTNQRTNKSNRPTTAIRNRATVCVIVTTAITVPKQQSPSAPSAPLPLLIWPASPLEKGQCPLATNQSINNVEFQQTLAASPQE